MAIKTSRDKKYPNQGIGALFTSFADTAGTIVVNQVMDIYNGLGQATRSYQAVNGAVDVNTTPFVQYDYSAPTNGSRLADMVYPNGRTVDYNYTGTNNNGALDNAIGRLVSISDGANSGDAGQVLEQYSYLGLSTIVQAAHPQTGINLTYIQQPGQTNVISSGGDIYTGLDQFGRVIDQNWWVVATGTSTDRFQYGYDANSNVLYKNNLLSASNSELYHANSTQSGDNNTAYDPLNRMTYFQRGYLTASGNNGGSLDTAPRAYTQNAWQLDALGNWTSYTTYETPQTRTFNSQNQITSAGGPGITTTPQYDANGNMIADQNGNTLVYDAWNRLVQVTDPAAQIIAKYSYNAMGYRISESYPQGGNGIAAGTVKYLYYSNNWQVLETRVNGTAATNVESQYVWSEMYIDAAVLRDTYINGTIQPAQRIYYQHDANFNTTAIVGLVGNAWQVTQRYMYTPYGVVTVLNADWTTAASQTRLTQYLHQGGRQDPITGLYLFRHRDYSPTLGNWIEQDPAGYVDGGNRYVALGDSPGARHDASGLAAIPQTMDALFRASVGGHGNFDGTSLYTPTKKKEPYSGGISVQFNVSKSLKNKNKRKCDCQEIEFIQFYIAQHSSLDGYSISNGGNWKLDLNFSKHPPFYAYQTPWVAGGPAHVAIMTDSPGAYGTAQVLYTFFQEDFYTWAVCAKGKEKGAAYGHIHWGIRFHMVGKGHYSIWLVGAHPWMARGKVGTSQTLQIPYPKPGKKP